LICDKKEEASSNENACLAFNGLYDFRLLSDGYIGFAPANTLNDHLNCSHWKTVSENAFFACLTVNYFLPVVGKSLKAHLLFGLYN